MEYSNTSWLDAVRVASRIIGGWVWWILIVAWDIILRLPTREIVSLKGTKNMTLRSVSTLNIEPISYSGSGTFGDISWWTVVWKIVSSLMIWLAICAWLTMLPIQWDTGIPVRWWTLIGNQPISKRRGYGSQELPKSSYPPVQPKRENLWKQSRRFRMLLETNVNNRKLTA